MALPICNQFAKAYWSLEPEALSRTAISAVVDERSSAVVLKAFARSEHVPSRPPTGA
ncbi:hypothetical protein VARIO8X_60608 [Burkholderiales bacterium 8X]|nr:hypothetical protein VARIO8X_60608 [Burkholderiales bacterium 8X]